MAAWVLREDDLPALLGAGEFSERYIPEQRDGGATFSRWKPGAQPRLALRTARGSASLKSFCFLPKQVVACYGARTDHPDVAVADRRMVVGVRACELQAVRYLDRVFTTPPGEDPFYQACRESQTIISVDCVQPHETCFCNVVGGRPFATEGFDLNLTPIDGAYVVEVGSDAGRALVERASAVLEQARPEQLADRERVREAASEQLARTNDPYLGVCPPRRPITEREDSSVWERLGSRCVECGACTQICPTCHCFYLYDRGGPDAVFERLRAWDSCLWSGYSRMAGADRMKPNPRARFRSRFANRFLHKFVWSLQQWDMLGCVGCGRCVEACPGRIDVRQVLREVSG